MFIYNISLSKYLLIKTRSLYSSPHSGFLGFPSNNESPENCGLILPEPVISMNSCPAVFEGEEQDQCP